MLDRALTRLAAESWLADALSPRVVRMDLDKMPDAWKAGHIDVATLWDLFVQYPNLSRMSDRDVLERGVAEALNDTLGWDAATFALAAGIDESTGRYVDLRLPGDSAPFTVTGTTLLVQPARALAQRADDERRAAERTAPSSGRRSGGGTTSGGDPDPVEKPSAKPTLTRFFGSRKLDPQKFGKNLVTINDEVLQRLVEAGAELEISIEIHATKADGFSDAVVRTVSENASVLKFDPASFDREQPCRVTACANGFRALWVVGKATPPPDWWAWPTATWTSCWTCRNGHVVEPTSRAAALQALARHGFTRRWPA